MKKSNLIAGVLARVSTEEQVLSESIDVHIDRCVEHCKRQNWPVKKVYKLPGVSGKSVMSHREIQKMLADVREGRINVLVFSSLSRLGRNSIELQQIEKIFSESGCYLVSLRENIDTSTPAGANFFRLLCSFAQYETEEISARVQAGILTRYRMGKVWGKAPFGYVKDPDTKDLIPCPETAPIRALMYDLLIEHQNIRGVCKILNDRGYRSRSGEKFSPKYLRHLIADPSAKGVIIANKYKNKVIAKPKDQWIELQIQPIVSVEKWERAQRILSERRETGKNYSNSKKHAYSGIIKCGSCGGGLSFRKVENRHKKELPRYRCNHDGCTDRVSMLHSELDALIAQSVLGVVLNDIPDNALITQSETESDLILNQAQSELAKLKKAKSKLIDAYELDAITLPELKERIEPMSTRIAELEREIESLSQQSQGKADHETQKQILAALRENGIKWGDLLNDEKKELLSLITNSIVLHRDRLEIEFTEMPDFILLNDPTGQGPEDICQHLSGRVTVTLARTDKRKTK